MTLDNHMKEALAHYRRIAMQMSPAKAGAHTCQQYGVTPQQLSAALRDPDSLFLDIDAHEPEEVA